MFRFSNHTFDPDTGELDGPRESLRLQPKPARLLAMLLDAGGELVEREEIRAALWPDTNVDFDAGLNTCMRQIRTAVRETGGDVEHIETLPKRGYRITVAVEGNAHHVERREPATPPAAVRPSAAASLPYVVTVVLLAIGTAVVLWGELSGYPAIFSVGAARDEPAGSVDSSAPGVDGTVIATTPARLAVVPFVDPSSDAGADFNRDLTEAFVTALANAAPQDIVVIGPSTTASYFIEGSSLPDIAAAVNADFVLHGGYRSSSDIFFVEVVLPDGEQLFAQRMDLDLGARAIAPPDVVEAMTAAIVAATGR